MASLIHEPTRPRKPWRVDWVERGGRRTSKRFETERKARAWMVSLERGAAASTARLRLEDWLGQWMTTHGPSWSARTLSDRGYFIDRLIAPHLGRMRLGEITRPDVRHWRSRMLSDGVPAKVANDAVRVLSAALGSAVDDDVLVGNPCRGLRPLPEAPVERVPATLDEVEAIRVEIPDPRDRVVVSLMAYGGLRPAEVRQLRVRDIRPSALFVMRAEGGDGRTKGTKTGASRTVPIIGPLREDLDALPAGGPDDPVIGRAIDWDAWTKWVWRPARARAECDPAPYALRHTFASLLIAEGRTVFEVAQRLGHSTPTLTMSTYGHLFAEAQLTDGQDMEQAAIAARRRAPRLREEREARHEAVLAALPASVDQVTDLTGITPALVHAALASLQARRLIEPDPDMTGAWRVRRRGRPPRTEAA